MQTRKVPWSSLDGLVPDEHDKYWELTLKFLKIARENWPEHLRQTGRKEASHSCANGSSMGVRHP